MRRALSILLLAAFLAPAASAGHWTLYYVGVDESAGETMEPDGAAIDAPWHLLHGQTNRVTLPGNVPGDGARFLDARLGVNAGGNALYPDVFFESLLGRRDLLLRESDVSAWYGEWLDVNQDGRIDDLEGAACPSACPGDEFAWRGAVSSHSDNVYMTVLVGEHVKNTQGSPARSFELADGTLTGEGWHAPGPAYADTAFLTTTQTFTIAGATRALGGAYRYVLDEPEALWDVDRYVAINPDVESLVLNSASTIWIVRQDALTYLIDDVLIPTQKSIFDLYDQYGAGNAESNAMALATALQQQVAHAYQPPYPKEPNHIDDDFGGFATFGGVGDADGSFNTYPGYASGFHLYFDNVAYTWLCGGAWAGAPGTPVNTGHEVGCTARTRSRAGEDSYNTDPVGANVNGERGSGTVLMFGGRHVLWKDVNQDAHIGKVCDPDSEAFDAERNTCIGQRGRHEIMLSNNEYVNLCDAIRASMRGRGYAITLTPVGANWPGVVIARDFNTPTRGIIESGWEVRADALPITLRWNPDCARQSMESKSTDALIFPAGASTIPVRVEAYASIESYRDVENGIDIAAETVRDVDVLMPVM